MSDEVKQANMTRAQRAKKLHEVNTAQRKQAMDELKAIFRKEKDGPIVKHLLYKAREFASYHHKLAKDGVGAKVVGTDEGGQPVTETYYLTSEQRIAELDQAKGMEQLIGYIERLTDTASTSPVQPQEPQEG